MNKESGGKMETYGKEQGWCRSQHSRHYLEEYEIYITAGFVFTFGGR